MERRNRILSIIIIFTCLMVLFLLIHVHSGSSKTITVDDDGGGEYVSIQDAVDAAYANDTIHVFDGTYRETVIVNISLSLIGNGSMVTVIDSEGYDTALWINEEGVNVSGFNITNSRSFWTSDHGIYINSSNCNISQCSFSRTGFGIYLYYSPHCTIVDSEFYSLSRDGVYAYRSARCWISNCEMIQPNRNGCGIEQSDGCVIVDNTFSGTHLVISSSDNCFISNNTSTSSDGGISLSSSKNCIITNNVISPRIGNGIEASYSDNCIISYNNCSSGEIGISLHYSDNSQVFNNHLAHNERGFQSTFSTHGEIRNNNCSFNSEYGMMISNSHFVDIVNNTCTNGLIGMTIGNSEHALIQDNVVSNNVEVGINVFSSGFGDIVLNDISSNGIGIHFMYRFPECSVRRNTITKNKDYAIKVELNPGDVVNATYNHWGNDSGPNHRKLNPNAKGGNITNDILFNPWLDDHGNLVYLQEKPDDDEPNKIPLYLLFVILVGLFTALIVVIRTPNQPSREPVNNRPVK